MQIRIVHQVLKHRRACVVWLIITVNMTCALAQPQGLSPHPNMPWLPGAYTLNISSIGSLLDFNYRDSHTFMLGGNWGTPDKEYSTLLGISINHLGDQDLVPNKSSVSPTLLRQTTVQQRLIPEVRYLSIWMGGPLEIFMRQDASYAAAQSMEYATWLEWNADTHRPSLLLDDVAGSVFCFKVKNHGQVDNYQGTGQYELLLSKEEVQQWETVVKNVWPDTVLRWTMHDLPEGGPGRGQNTSKMLLTFSVRRRSVNGPGVDDDTPILRIKMPYYLGMVSTQQVMHLTRFREVSDPTMAPTAMHGANSDDNNNIIGYYLYPEEVTNSDGYTDEIVITAGMLPDDVGDMITYSAVYYSYPHQTEEIPNMIVDGSSIKYYNHRYYQEGKSVTSQDEEMKYNVSRYDIELEYNGKVDIGVPHIRLETPEASKLYWRQYDKEIAGESPYPNAPLSGTGGLLHAYLQGLEDRNAVLNTVDPQTQSFYETKLFRVYGKDEPMLSNWKTMRYLNLLLDKKMITEWFPFYQEGADHCMQIDINWTGTTLRMHDETQAYTYNRGYNPDRTAVNEGLPEYAPYRAAYAGIRYGRSDGDGRITSNPDTDIDKYSAELPLTPSSLYDTHITMYARGVQPAIEYILNNGYYKNHAMIYGEKPWIANIWLHSGWHYGMRTDNTYWAICTNNGRPKTAEEMRAQIWSNIILGAKGLMFYVSIYGPATEPTQTSKTLDWKGPLQSVVYPPALQGSSQVHAAIDGDQIGGDWLEQNDLSSLDKWMHGDIETVADNLHITPTSQGVYVGRKTSRQIVREVLLPLRTSIDELTYLRLEAWHGRGYKRLNSSRSSQSTADVLANYINVSETENGIKTRPIDRVSVPVYSTANPGQPYWEPIDSNFLDVTLFSHENDPDMTNTFYFGIFNRRTDPEAVVGGQMKWQSYESMLALWASDPTKLYCQKGCREVRVPFAVPNEPVTGNYRMLRVTEIGGSVLLAGNEPILRRRLDTLVGQNSTLDIKLLPGEGRMYRVQYIPSKSLVSSGYMDHNTQSKIVVYPSLGIDTETGLHYQMVTDAVPSCTGIGGVSETDVNGAPTRQYIRTVAGDERRYHMVYHRRRVLEEGATADNGPLSVYYRRSYPVNDPLEDGSVVDLGSILWEDEILLSDDIVNSSGLPYVNTDPSCGYPSIVVRYNRYIDRNEVYVVYSCESASPNADIAIVEALLSADVASHDEQEAQYHWVNQRSVVIGASHSGGLNANDRLYYWGTPVVNASTNGNYYAWSRADMGIQYAYKLPGARTFNGTGGPQSMHAYQQPDPNTWVARYPTINTYSRLHIGEEEASIAWQEGPPVGENGRAILYSRVAFNDITQEPEHFITRGDPVQDITHTNVVGQLIDANRVLVVEDAGYGSTDINRKPSLYRMLSDFPDEAIEQGSSMAAIGHLNHKADRIVWEQSLLGPVGYEPSTIAHRMIDLTDVCSQAQIETQLNLNNTSLLWASGVDLVQPEIKQGQVSTELNTNAMFPELHPDSWRYGDTALMLSFVYRDGMAINPATHGMIYSLSYGHTFTAYGDYDASDEFAAISDLGGRVRLNKLDEQGRNPHVAARYTTTVRKGLSRSRRVYENDDTRYQIGGYTGAPSITRSNVGFYKPVQHDIHGVVNSRAWYGYRTMEGQALLSDISIDGIEVEMQPVDRGRHNGGNDKRSMTYCTEWMTLRQVSELSLMGTGRGEPLAKAYIERKRDKQAMMMNVFDRKQKYEWMLYVDTTEKYRIVLEAVQEGVTHVVDRELYVAESNYWKASEKSVIRANYDLVAMQALNEEDLQEYVVRPIPAVDQVTISPKSRVVRRVHSVQVFNAYGRAESMTYSSDDVEVVVDTALLASGLYCIQIVYEDGYIGKSTIQIIR